MPDPLRQPPWLKFGPFLLDPQSGELLKGSIRLRLPGQPFKILNHLLSHPGQVITREELRDQVWCEGTYVDFEHSLNAAINRLRRTLNDAADRPRYIETIPGRGYRFIGNVDSVSRSDAGDTAAALTVVAETTPMLTVPELPAAPPPPRSVARLAVA